MIGPGSDKNLPCRNDTPPSPPNTPRHSLATIFIGKCQNPPLIHFVKLCCNLFPFHRKLCRCQFAWGHFLCGRFVSMCNKNIIRNCKKKSKNVYFVLLQKHSLLTSNIFSTSPLLSLEIWNSISTLFNAFVNQKIYFKESSKKSTTLIWRALIPSDRVH